MQMYNVSTGKRNEAGTGDFDALSGKKDAGSVDDESYIWETLAQKSLVLFPHSPFCELAAACFSFGEVPEEVSAYQRK